MVLFDVLQGFVPQRDQYIGERRLMLAGPAA
jgi:hypothetical protein